MTCQARCRYYQSVENPAWELTCGLVPEGDHTPYKSRLPILCLNLEVVAGNLHTMFGALIANYSGIVKSDFGQLCFDSIMNRLH